jgi:hypothetical protein
MKKRHYIEKLIIYIACAILSISILAINAARSILTSERKRSPQEL